MQIYIITQVQKRVVFVYGLLFTAARANLHNILVLFSPPQNYSSKIVHDLGAELQGTTTAEVRMLLALIGYLYFDKT